MKVIFYARPWSVDLFLAVEEQWRTADHHFEVAYISNHLEADAVARSRGRTSTFLPSAIAELELPDPIEALRQIELRHGDRILPLMRYLMAERMFVGTPPDWQIDQLGRYATYFDRLYAHERPDAIIGEASDTMPNWLAYDLAPQYGCEPLGLCPSGIPPDRLMIARSHTELTGARRHYEELRARPLRADELTAARRLQDTILGAGTKLSYLPPERTVLALAARLLSGRPVRRQLRLAHQKRQERNAGNWFVQPNPVGVWLRQPARRVRAALADRRFLHDSPTGRPFVFLPLHMEPEAVLLVQSSYFANQIEVIHNLARSLPAHWELVVKEHFSMRGQRRLTAYRELAAIPNVRLASFEIPTNRLIQDADLVAVIAGTAGLEASLIGHPVVIFGENRWDFAPTVHRVGKLTDLPELLRTAASVRLGRDHPDVLAFAAAWDASLPPGRYYTNRGRAWLARENVELIASALWNVACRGADHADGIGPPRARIHVNGANDE